MERSRELVREPVRGALAEAVEILLVFVDDVSSFHSVAYGKICAQIFGMEFAMRSAVNLRSFEHEQ